MGTQARSLGNPLSPGIHDMTFQEAVVKELDKIIARGAGAIILDSHDLRAIIMNADRARIEEAEAELTALQAAQAHSHRIMRRVEAREQFADQIHNQSMEDIS